MLTVMNLQDHRMSAFRQSMVRGAQHLVSPTTVRVTKVDVPFLVSSTSSYYLSIRGCGTPCSLNPTKMTPWKRRFLLETIPLMFHIYIYTSFGGVISGVI